MIREQHEQAARAIPGFKNEGFTLTIAVTSGPAGPREATFDWHVKRENKHS